MSYSSCQNNAWFRKIRDKPNRMCRKASTAPDQAFIVEEALLEDLCAIAREMFQKAAKYFFMENNLEMAGLSYLEEGKCYLKLNKLPQALEAFKTALTTFEDINISSIRKGLNLRSDVIP